MSGDALAFAIGAAAGLAFSLGFLWLRRADVARAWNERRAELFGPAEPRPTRSPRASAGLRHPRLGFAMTTAALLACGAVAISTSDDFLRALLLVACGLLAISLAVLVRLRAGGGR